LQEQLLFGTIAAEYIDSNEHVAMSHCYWCNMKKITIYWWTERA